MAANPVAAGVAITVTRSIGADLFAQVKVEKKAFPSEVNWRRITGFALFGGLYVAVFMYYLYALVLSPLPTWIGINDKIVGGLFTTLVDQAVHTPFLYLPAYFVMVAWVNNEDAGIVGVFSAAYEQWRKEIKDTMKAALGVWLPAMTINFCVLPSYLAIPWINLVGLCWMLFLSIKSGASGDSASPKHPMALVTFDSVDANSDGVIDRDEFAAAFGDSGVSFESLDTNKDGVIDRQEFAKGARAKSEGEA